MVVALVGRGRMKARFGLAESLQGAEGAKHEGNQKENHHFRGSPQKSDTLAVSL